MTEKLHGQTVEISGERHTVLAAECAVVHGSAGFVLLLKNARGELHNAIVGEMDEIRVVTPVVEPPTLDDGAPSTDPGYRQVWDALTPRPAFAQLHSLAEVDARKIAVEALRLQRDGAMEDFTEAAGVLSAISAAIGVEQWDQLPNAVAAQRDLLRERSGKMPLRPDLGHAGPPSAVDPSHLPTIVDQLEGERRDLLGEISRLNLVKDEATAERDAYRLDVAEAATIIITRDREISRLRELVGTREKERDDLAAKLDPRRFDHVNEKIDSLQADLEDRTERLRDKTNEIAGLRQSLADARERSASSTLSWSAFQLLDAEPRNSAMTRLAAKAEADHVDSQAAGAKLSIDLATERARLSDAGALVNRAEALANAKNEVLANIDLELKAAHGHCANLEARIKASEGEISRLRTGADIASAVLLAKQAYIDVLTDRLSAAEAASADLLERIQNAEATLASPELHWECQQKLAAAEAVRDDARRVAQQRLDATRDLQGRLESYVRKNGDLMERAGNAAELAQVLDHCDELTRQRDQAVADRDALQAKLDAIKVHEKPRPPRLVTCPGCGVDVGWKHLPGCQAWRSFRDLLPDRVEPDVHVDLRNMHPCCGMPTSGDHRDGCKKS